MKEMTNSALGFNNWSSEIVKIEMDYVYNFGFFVHGDQNLSFFSPFRWMKKVENIHADTLQ